MIKCPECDDENADVCDFCKHYKFNGDKKGRYTGNGYCTFHNMNIDPSGGCNDFYCFRADNFIAKATHTRLTPKKTNVLEFKKEAK